MFMRLIRKMEGWPWLKSGDFPFSSKFSPQISHHPIETAFVTALSAVWTKMKSKKNKVMVLTNLKVRATKCLKLLEQKMKKMR